MRTYSIAGAVVAERTSKAGVSGTKLTWLSGDINGTQDLSLDQTAGSITRRFGDPYGNPRGASASWGSEHGYLNAPVSAFTTLTQLGARAYDALLGRFVSVDPVLAPDNPGQNNGYSYSANNPVTNSDPDGRCYVAGKDALSFKRNCGGGRGIAAPQVPGLDSRAAGPIAIAGAHGGSPAAQAESAKQWQRLNAPTTTPESNGCGWSGACMGFPCGTTSYNACGGQGIDAGTREAIGIALDVVVTFVPIGGVIWKVVRAGSRIISMSRSLAAESEGGPNFTSFGDLISHWRKHSLGWGKGPGKSWGEPDMPELDSSPSYLAAAQRLLGEKPPSTAVSGIRQRDGSMIRFDFDTGYLGIVGRDGNITTFFKPERGYEYFKEQFR
ncbi:MAG: RHS repeat-associated core domain-containing protein [Leifsonia sp.]